jgi:uncharacterized protein
VNGRTASVPAERGTFAAFHRRWRNNDTIQVSLPFSFHTEAIDNLHPNLVALMRGPLLLVGQDIGLKLDKSFIASPQGLTQIPYAVQTFETEVPAKKMRFEPFYRVREETYTTYVEQT